MTDDDKEYFQCKGKSKETIQEKLVAFWTDDYINGFTLNRKLITADRYASLLYSSAVDGNLVATKFFFQNISSEDSDVTVFDAVNVILKKGRHRDDFIFYEKGFGEVLNFLVPNMDEKNRTRIFLSNDKEKLYKYFLHYSRPIIFLKFVREFKAAFRVDLYVTLLVEILFKYLNGYISYNYQLFFKRFWQLIPKEFQNMISRFSPVGGTILIAVVKRKFPFMLEKSILFTYELSNRIKLQTSGVIRGSHLDKYKFFTYLIREGICTVESLNRVQDKFSEDLLDIGEEPPLVFNYFGLLINEIKNEPYKYKNLTMTELEPELSD
ncbi:hypothetical protein CEXT_414531 [Caerostris extrusa]|uniref:LAGLIDADG homing endonuclease n=1 Tax=Caerostris extrusa TaxID=172846 RepID=A0AAV4XPX6_CAEEX|nr:hypothetical protein CEXT_414531 [Caerostris extrusa]